MDGTVYHVLGGLLAALAGAYLLLAAVRVAERSRPGLSLLTPVLLAFGLRIAAGFAISAIGTGTTLRGGDELGFLAQARQVSDLGPTSSAGIDALLHQLYVWTFGTQMAIFGATPDVLRITQAAIATAGLLALALAVGELAGTRAARLTMWLLALEPADVFFSTVLHKEPLLLLAEGLVALGGARLWSRARASAVVPMAVGCLIALATRPYVGWFLIAATTAITLHWSLRHARPRTPGSLLLLAAGLAAVLVAASPALKATSPQSLAQLQSSQNANASDNSNLRLERVDYSTRAHIVTNLPKRIRDVLLRPYPWQLQSSSQRLGVLGTLVAWLGLGVLLLAIRRSWGSVLRRAGPLVYVAGALLVAYSLSAGNAGTAFRYRTHIVAVAIAAIVVLRARPLPYRARLPTNAPVPEVVVSRLPRAASG